MNLALQDTDPYFSRELLALLLSYFLFEGYFQRFTIPGFTPSQVFLSSLSSFYFLIPLLYASEASGLFARSLEKGSLGLLMTLPVRRDTLIWTYVISGSLFSALIFCIPALIMEWYLLPSFSPAISLDLLFLLMGLIFLYTTTGYLIASLLPNSIFTSILVLGFFFVMSLYSVKYFASNAYVEVLFSGFTYFNSSPSLDYATFGATLISFAASAVMLAAVPYIIKRRGIRSGR